MSFAKERKFIMLNEELPRHTMGMMTEMKHVQQAALQPALDVGTRIRSVLFLWMKDVPPTPDGALSTIFFR